MSAEEYIEHLKAEKRLAEELLAKCASYLHRGDVAQAELQERIAAFFGEIRTAPKHYTFDTVEDMQNGNIGLLAGDTVSIARPVFRKGESTTYVIVKPPEPNDEPFDFEFPDEHVI